MTLCHRCIIINLIEFLRTYYTTARCMIGKSDCHFGPGMLRKERLERDEISNNLRGRSILHYPHSGAIPGVHPSTVSDQAQRDLLYAYNIISP
jgi:hypothetical protein